MVGRRCDGYAAGVCQDHNLVPPEVAPVAYHRYVAATAAASPSCCHGSIAVAATKAPFPHRPGAPARSRPDDDDVPAQRTHRRWGVDADGEVINSLPSADGEYEPRWPPTTEAA